LIRSAILRRCGSRSGNSSILIFDGLLLLIGLDIAKSVFRFKPPTAKGGR
jgi:hypothetical protein